MTLWNVIFFSSFFYFPLTFPELHLSLYFFGMHSIHTEHGDGKDGRNGVLVATDSRLYPRDWHTAIRRKKGIFFSFGGVGGDWWVGGTLAS